MNESHIQSADAIQPHLQPEAGIVELAVAEDLGAEALLFVPEEQDVDHVGVEQHRDEQKSRQDVVEFAERVEGEQTLQLDGEIECDGDDVGLDEADHEGPPDGHHLEILVEHLQKSCLVLHLADDVLDEQYDEKLSESQEQAGRVDILERLEHENVLWSSAVEMASFEVSLVLMLKLCDVYFHLIEELRFDPESDK